ncbi:MAG: hypothetical protein JNM40_25040 [Myxococcales bacterium]|nr:hypothetical protein [Myxococcales bacterium]
MSDSKTCRHQTLAHSRFAQVQRCLDCGCISLHVGSITMRLDENALEGLSELLSEAVSTLHFRKGIVLTSDQPRGLA